MNGKKRLNYNFEKIFVWDKDQSSSLLSCLQFIPGTPEYVAFGGSNLPSVEHAAPPLPDVSTSTSCNSDAGVQCSVCGVWLGGREDQLLHYATAYHHHNQERLLRGLQRLSLDQFNAQTHASVDSSLSGSEDEDSDTCSLSEQDELDANDEEDSSQSPRRTPRLHLHNTTTGCVVSVYRALLLPKKAMPESGEALLRAASDLPGRHRWCYLMQSGGHFAGAVFDGEEVVVHKTFHSYTVRSGQGKSQGSYDNSCGSGQPRSAGASLRRYNEASHRQHVQEILEQWRELLEQCNLIFTRVSRRSQALLLGGAKTRLIDARDPRLRTIPFPTRKPTFAEIKRVHRLMAEVRIHGPLETFVSALRDDAVSSSAHDVQKRERVRRCSKTADDRHHSATSSSSGTDEPEHQEVVSSVERFQALMEADVPHAAKARKKKTKKKRKQKSNNNEEDISQNLPDTVVEEEMQSGLDRVRDVVYTCCRSGDLRRLKALVAFCQSGDAGDADGCELSAGVVACVERYRDRFSVLSLALTEDSKTLLHVATENNRHQLVKWLLEEGGCDPSVRDRRHKAPYSCCTTNTTRAVYRTYRAAHPNAHNYAKSCIPPPVSAEEERRRDEERQARRVAQKARQKENKLKKQRLLDEQRERERYLNLSDREKRALAAERRLLSAQTSAEERPVLLRCFQCAADISGLVPFEYSDNHFCSTACVRAHRSCNRPAR